VEYRKRKGKEKRTKGGSPTQQPQPSPKPSPFSPSHAGPLSLSFFPQPEAQLSRSLFLPRVGQAGPSPFFSPSPSALSSSSLPARPVPPVRCFFPPLATSSVLPRRTFLLAAGRGPRCRPLGPSPLCHAQPGYELARPPPRSFWKGAALGSERPQRPARSGGSVDPHAKAANFPLLSRSGSPHRPPTPLRTSRPSPPCAAPFRRSIFGESHPAAQLLTAEASQAALTPSLPSQDLPEPDQGIQALEASPRRPVRERRTNLYRRPPR
jgi:hypothetical protein